jgi:hypothetical protein
MKRNIRNIIATVVGTLALATLCMPAWADPFNPIFLQVDINCGDEVNSATQTNFVGWPLPGWTVPESYDVATSGKVFNATIQHAWPYQPAVTTNQWTMVFPTNLFLTNFPGWVASSNITVTLMATNWNPTNDYSKGYPYGMTWDPWDWMPLVATTNFGNGTVGETWSNLYSDFFYVQHACDIGYGWDFISLTISNLVPNTNYEITVWDANLSSYPYYNADYVAWGPTNPETLTIITNAASPNGTNVPMFANYVPQPGGGGTIPKLARVLACGPNPSIQDPGDQEFAYSGSFYVTSDNNGTVTAYAWEDDDSWVGNQSVPLNGFAIGFAATLAYAPITNAVTTVTNPVPAQLSGSSVTWPYTCGALKINTDGAFTDQSYGDTLNIQGETFQAPRDFMLRNFYIACTATTNSGRYALLLYDFGTNSAPASFNPGNYTNLLGHPDPAAHAYWVFSPNSLTNRSILKIKLPGSADQVYMTNGHNYFLGFQYVGAFPNTNNTATNNDMIWESTSSGKTYASGAAYQGSLTSVSSISRNFIMAVDVLATNLGYVNVYSYPIQTNSNGSGFPATSTWPSTPAAPVYATFTDPYHGDTNIMSPGPSYMFWPYIDTLYNFSYIDSGNAGTDGTGTGREALGAGRCLDMNFVATNSFTLGAVALRERGLGSSNCLWTLAVYDITNAFIVVTNTGSAGDTNLWPDSFTPGLQAVTPGIPVMATNLDFYITAANGANGPGGGTHDQLLVLAIDTNHYPINIQSGHAYAVELSADLIGQNNGDPNLLQWIRSTNRTTFEIEAYTPIAGHSQGFKISTNSPSTPYWALPKGLSASYSDPEDKRSPLGGDSPSTTTYVYGRDLVMALYATPPTPLVTSIEISTNVILYQKTNVVITWNSVPGVGYSVLRTNNLKAPTVNWPVIVTGYSGSGSSLSYTDVTSAATMNFYRVSNP